MVASDTSGHGVVSTVDEGDGLSVVQLPQLDRPKALVEQLEELADPSLSGWDTEGLSDAAMVQLKKLAALAAREATLTGSAVRHLVHERFSCGSLVPSELEVAYRDRHITVERGEVGVGLGSTRSYVGPEGLATAFRALLEPLGDDTPRDVHFKLFTIEKADGEFTTRLLVDATGSESNRSGQVNATWQCRWVLPQVQGESPPRLLGISAERYERVSLRIDGGRLFVDCTESALADNASYQAHILPGINHWLTRIPFTLQLSLMVPHGVTVGDVNGDGLEDLYMCETGALPNRLFVQDRDGTLTDVSASSGVGWLNSTPAALLIDLDNDGDQDLAAVTIPNFIVCENDGTGHFRIRWSRRITLSGKSVCAADYDNDGDVDIYVCSSTPSDLGGLFPVPIPYYDANNGGPNVLLRNDGDFQFKDVTVELGLDVNNTRFSLAAGWEDYDNDGDQDLYVANDFGRNCLYRNDLSDGGGFVDVAPLLEVEDMATGMSVSWADYDRNGRMDLYVGNMFSAAGNRIAYQRRIADAQGDQFAGRIQRMARGNTLFANLGGDGEAPFSDVSEAANVTMGRWAWASKFADLNNDGWSDLVVANGYITNEDTADL